MPFQNAPHDRTLPDTNVWLDAAFVPHSVGARAIAAIKAEGQSILIDELTEREAFSVLERLRKSIPLNFDPAEQLRKYIASVAPFHVPAAAPDIPVIAVNRADRHVARAAIYYQAAVLTGDAPLAAQCQRENVFSVFPWEILTRNGPQEADVIRAMPIESTGTIFARVTPGGWLGMPNAGQRSVIDVTNLGWLYYNAAKLEWVFEAAIGLSLRLNYPPALQGKTVVCLSYSLYGRGSRGTLVLRAGRFGFQDNVASSESTLKQLDHFPGEIKLGSKHGETNFWNGNIRHLTIGPEVMSSEKWKAIISLENGAPNPMNHRALRIALESIDRSQALPWF
jgi:predicted nucleic acid-binding protein